MTTKKLKAAIYTRKSTEHGLEQDFNSLAAQREAAEAYIISQKSQGWVLVNDSYDDGGISGGTMERPALQKLLEDVEKGRVDIIIVYKVDRLTRSLSDFARIIDLLDAADASFVSVTQQFNTTDSMGRLTLNVLLSFAQFEREVTAERIRDKILASKRKGMWMGGTVPLGYDNVDKKLVVIKKEAELVRLIFKTYLNSTGVKQTCHKLNELGYRTKSRKDVKPGNLKFCCGHIYYILKNRVYIGEVAHKRKHYPGNHKAIIDPETWEVVQKKIQSSRAKIKSGVHFKNPSLLVGLLKTDAGETLSPTHANKKGKRYRYYITKSDEIDHKETRYPAKQIENAVIEKLVDRLEEYNLQEIYGRSNMIKILTSGSPSEKRTTVQQLLKSVTISAHQLEIQLDDKIFGQEGNEVELDRGHTLIFPVSFKEGKKLKKLVIPSGRHIVQTPNRKLITLIAKAHLYAKELQSGKYQTMKELSEKLGVNKSDLGKQIRLAYLTPDIVTAVFEGRQSTTLNATRLRRLKSLPFDWVEQRELLGTY